MILILDKTEFKNGWESFCKSKPYISKTEYGFKLKTNVFWRWLKKRAKQLILDVNPYTDVTSEIGMHNEDKIKINNEILTIPEFVACYGDMNRDLEFIVYSWENE